MSSAPEAFVIALGRASRKGQRVISSLQQADRDDIMASAILWCWENKETYRSEIPVEVWFAGAVRNAYKAWSRGEGRTVEELQESIQVPDDTERRAEVESAAQALVRSLSPEEREIARLRAQGYTRAELRKLFGIERRAVDAVLRKLKPLRRILPESSVRTAIGLTRPASSDDAQGRPLVGIDKALDRMLGPPAGKDRLYADDWRAEARAYVAEEDCRGKVLGFHRPGFAMMVKVTDYEGNEPNRRILVGDPAGQQMWLSEAFLR